MNCERQTIKWDDITNLFEFVETEIVKIDN